MQWISHEEMLAGLAIPSAYRFEQIGRGDLDDVIACLRAWYPDIRVGAESRHLTDLRQFEKWTSAF